MVEVTSSQQRLERVVKTIAQVCVDNESYFCDLDSAAGDGDFGYSLARGFEKVLESWMDFDRSSPAVFLEKVALTMSSRIGGTSGPIWGTAFIRASSAIAEKDVLTNEDAVQMLESAVEGIKARGGAEVGDKTLLDALVPLTVSLKQSVAESVGTKAALSALVDAANSGAKSTENMQARRGRASYTGERSIGSPDPGAVAVALLAERIAENW